MPHVEPPPIDDPVYDELLRVYFASEPDDRVDGTLVYRQREGYPWEWDRSSFRYDVGGEPPYWSTIEPRERELTSETISWFEAPAIKHIVRMRAQHRCERCRHPFLVGAGLSKWSPCDEHCTHDGPMRFLVNGVWSEDEDSSRVADVREAQWRILTVHHLNGVKHDCRWWNLAALCQRCHLTIQSKVHLDRPYDRPHTEWFRPHAAGYYSAMESEACGDPEDDRLFTLDHMDEILQRYATQGVLL